MNRSIPGFHAAACLMLLLPAPAPAGTLLNQAFTYQGRLLESGVPANGAYTLEFRLFDDPAAGAQVGSTITLANVAVVEGLFTVVLNGGGEFGSSAFHGDARWLEIAVNGIELSPRQPLTAAPFAVYALAPWAVGTGGIFYSGGAGRRNRRRRHP
jgi:hypothetical protein